jgi:hypothetical protein
MPERKSKLYGGPDGHTLEQLKKMAPVAQTLNGVKFEGNSFKLAAILGVAAAGVDLVAEVERLQRELDECNEAMQGMI